MFNANTPQSPGASRNVSPFKATLEGAYAPALAAYTARVVDKSFKKW
jgi:hypothetical protein